MEPKTKQRRKHGPLMDTMIRVTMTWADRQLITAAANRQSLSMAAYLRGLGIEDARRKLRFAKYDPKASQLPLTGTDGR